MKPSLHFIIPLIIISFITSGNTQNDPVHNVSHAVQQINDALDLRDPWHYKAEMRFREMGGDTFEIRNFSVNYKANKANSLYGYDWEISEVIDSGYTYTWIALPESFYVIFDGTKSIGQCDLLKTIDFSSYPEYIRGFFALSEVFSPFTTVLAEDIIMMDSGNTYSLTRQMNDLATRQLIVSKDTYLPIQSISRITDNAFNLLQITEVNFYYNDSMRTLPDTAFSLAHLMSLGYTIKHNEQSESTTEDEMRTLSPESIKFILHYPFVTETGDTISIPSSTAGYILMDFWYASCMPCLQALPAINQLAVDYADEGLVVLGINCFDKGIRANMSKKLRDKNITIPLFFGSRDLIDSLKINSFPTYLLITPDQHVEYIEGNEEDVMNLLNAIFHK